MLPPPPERWQAGSMTGRHGITLTTITLGASEPRRLAEFYSRLLDWPLEEGDETWVAVRDPDGGVGVAAQYEEHHVRPAWPGAAGEQQMQAHLEIRVDDLDAAAAYAVECGATVAAFQPQDDVRVCIDPAGHPFCLWIVS